MQINQFLKIKSGKRIWEIDALRGICILLVILDHMARITYYYFGRVWYGNCLDGDSTGAKICRFFYLVETSEVRNQLRVFVLFCFFSLSGISSGFSRSNLKRAAWFGLVACFISIFTYILQESFGIAYSYVEFGTIHFLSFCVFFYVILDFLTKKVPFLKYGISLLLIIGIIIEYFAFRAPSSTPQWAYFIFPYKYVDGTRSNFYNNNKVSPGDLMNLIPWSAFYLAGVVLKPLLYPENKSILPALDRGWHKPLSFIGRHSLIVYLTHILPIGIILLIISKVCFGTWAVF